LRLSINVVLACKYIGQSNNKCNLTYEQNCIIIKYVFDYLKSLERFFYRITRIELGEHAHHENPIRYVVFVAQVKLTA
jgi:hypothetical protein